MSPDQTDKREAIMDAALELFADRGFHGTSIAQIAELAHVGAGTIYRYFADKEVLVNSVYKHWKQEMVMHILEDFPTGVTARTLFRELWARLAQFSRDNPMVLQFVEFHHHASYLDEESNALSDRFLNVFHEQFEKFRLEEITKDVPPELLMAVVSGMFFGMEKAFANGLVERTSEMESMAEQICWEAVRR